MKGELSWYERGKMVSEALGDVPFSKEMDED